MAIFTKIFIFVQYIHFGKYMQFFENIYWNASQTPHALRTRRRISLGDPFSAGYLHFASADSKLAPKGALFGGKNFGAMCERVNYSV